MDTLIAQAVPFADTWSMHGGDVGFGWWLVMTVGMVLFWGGVLTLVVFLLRGDARATPSEGPSPAEPAAHQVLDRRLADGSIDVEEYERRRRVLQDTRDRTRGENTALGASR